MTEVPRPEPSEGLLSVSLVTYHITEPEFLSVLQSLDTAIRCLCSSVDTRVQVRIVDNGGQAAMLGNIIEDFRSEYAAYELIGDMKNIGYGRGHNLAILTSSSKFHLILNPDVLLNENCLLEGVNYLEANDDISAVAPHAVDSDGNTQYLCKAFPSVLDLLIRGFVPGRLKAVFTKRLGRYELRDKIHNKTVDDIPIISGCFMLCRTGDLKRVGGFDERFFLYFEDFALSMELNRHGRLSYLPSMKIQHFGGNSAGKGIRHILLFIRSGITFFNTYGWKFI